MVGSTRKTLRAGAWAAAAALVMAGVWLGAAAPVSAATPGGTTGTDFWLRADRGTGTSTSDAPVQTWTDQAVPANTVTQAAAASRPTLALSSVNFNPALRFSDGATSRWFTSNIDTAYTTSGKGKYSFWAVAVPDATRSGYILSSDDGLPNAGSFDRWVSYNNGGILQGATGQAYGPAGGITGGTAAGPKLIRVYYNQGVVNGSSGWVAGMNGGTFTSTMDDTAAPLALGALDSTGTASFRGTVAEMIGVAGTQNDDAATTARIQSYLAAKYGMTLGDADNVPGGNMAISSVNSAGTAYWSAPVAYQNNVTVIARDAVSDFDQRVSQAATTTSLPVTLAAGAYGFTGTITPTAPTTALNDLASVAIGDDNGSAAITTPATAGVTARMGRVWRVQTAGSTPAQISVRLPASAVTLPANARTLYAVSATTATFTSPVMSSALTLQNGFYVGTIPTPENGAFLSFGSRVADPGTSTIVAAPPTITADGTSTSTVTVTLRDAHGDPIIAGGDTVTIVKNSGAGALSGVVDRGDGTYIATLTAPVTAGTAALGFTVNGATGTPTATVTYAPGAASAEGSTITATAHTVTAGGSTPVTVAVRDINGNPLGAAGAGRTVAMTTNLGTISAPATDNGDGTYTAILTSPRAGTATVGFRLDATAGTATDAVEFVPGAADPATSTITADPTSITADGVSTSTLTVTLLDAEGNTVSDAGDVVGLTTTSGTLSAVTDNGDGTYSATLTSAVIAGSATVAFTVDGTPATVDASVEFTAGGASAVTSTIAAAPPAITADGTSTSTITVTVRDAQGNTVKDGAGIVVTTDAGTIGAAVDNGDGTWSATLTSPTAVGSANVGFTVDATVSPNSTVVGFTAGAASAASSTISASPSAVTADGVSTSTVTVTLIDINGNPLSTSGGTVTMSSDAGALSNVTDNADGTYTAVLTSAVAAGTATVTFTVNGTESANTATVVFTAGAADPTTSTIVASPTLIPADGASTSTITVTLLDANANPVGSSGGTVSLTADVGTLGGVTDHGDGTYTAAYTSPTSITPPAATIGFALDGTPGTQTATVAFVAGAPSTTTSEIVANPTTITADGASTSTITVTLRDGNDNVVSGAGAVVGMTTSTGSLSAVTDNGDGTYTATLTSATTAGTAIERFTIDGAGATDTATVGFVAGAPDARTSTISAAPSAITADGVSTSALTVTLFDARGNRVLGGGAGVVISTTGGTIGDAVDNGDGTYTATLTSAEAAGTATLSFTVGGTTGAATTTVAFTAGAADPVASGITASSTTIENDGVTPSTITVTLLDATGNPLNAGGDTVTLTTTLGTVSPVVDNGDGSYTGTLTSTVRGQATVGFLLNGVTATETATVTAVDTIAPAPPVITAPADGATVPGVPLISGSGDPAATVTVFSSGGDEICTAVVDTAGGWSCFPARPLPEGDITLFATQSDPAGNEGGESNSITVTVDGTRPPPPVPAPTNGDVVSGTSEPRTTVIVRDTGGDALCTTVTDSVGEFACTPATRIPTGTVLVLTATDGAGNVSDPASVRVGGPTIALDRDVAAAGDTQVATGRGFLPGESVSGILTSSPVDLGTLTADATGTVTFTFVLPADIEPGTHRVTLTGERSGDVSAEFDVSPSATPLTPGLLSTTGGTGLPWHTGVAILLVVFGGLIAVTGRRRRVSRSAGSSD